MLTPRTHNGVRCIDVFVEGVIQGSASGLVFGCCLALYMRRLHPSMMNQSVNQSMSHLPKQAARKQIRQSICQSMYLFASLMATYQSVTCYLHQRRNRHLAPQSITDQPVKRTGNQPIDGAIGGAVAGMVASIPLLHFRTVSQLSRHSINQSIKQIFQNSLGMSVIGAIISRKSVNQQIEAEQLMSKPMAWSINRRNTNLFIRPMDQSINQSFISATNRQFPRWMNAVD